MKLTIIAGYPHVPNRCVGSWECSHLPKKGDRVVLDEDYADFEVYDSNYAPHRDEGTIVVVGVPDELVKKLKRSKKGRAR